MHIASKIPKKRKKEEWYYESEPSYNPYINKWEGGDGYKTLAECGITCNEKEFKIDIEKLKKVSYE